LFSSSTRNIALGSASTTVPSTGMPFCLAIQPFVLHPATVRVAEGHRVIIQ
jgi:hypothetical protein